MILIGNSYPLSLVRRPLSIVPAELTELQQFTVTEKVASFWGHKNTLRAASEWLGVNLQPITERPSLRLDAEGYPFFMGQSYQQCWVISCELPPGYRPQIGEEVTRDKILSWQLLKLTWQ